MSGCIDDVTRQGKPARLGGSGCFWYEPARDKQGRALAKHFSNLHNMDTVNTWYLKQKTHPHVHSRFKQYTIIVNRVMFSCQGCDLLGSN